MNDIVKINVTHADLELVRGDDDAFEFTFSDELGAIDITDWTVFFTVRSDNNEEDDTNAIIKKVITEHTDPEHGKTEIQITEEDSNQPIDSYYYDIQIKDDSNKIKTVVIGNIFIVQDVTKSTS